MMPAPDSACTNIKREASQLVDSLSPNLGTSSRKGRRSKGRVSKWLSDFVVDPEAAPSVQNAKGGWRPPTAGEKRPREIKYDITTTAGPSNEPHHGSHTKNVQVYEDRNDDGPREDSMGVRVAAWWEAERRSYAGTVTRFNPSKHEYLVEYEDDDSQAWHLWGDLHVLPDKPHIPRPAKPLVLNEIANGLVMLAETIRGAAGGSDCIEAHGGHGTDEAEEATEEDIEVHEGDEAEASDLSRSQGDSVQSGDSGLMALSAAVRVAKQEQEPPDLRALLSSFSQTVEKEVGMKLKCRKNGRAPPQGQAWFSEIKGIVTQVMHKSKRKLGPRMVVTAQPLLKRSFTVVPG